jgi:hypothetical protein
MGRLGKTAVVPASADNERCRFLVREDGLFHELFTLQRLMKDGTVSVLIRPDDNFGGLSDAPFGPPRLGGAGVLAEFRFSLHPSIGKDGLSVTTNVRHDGRKITGKLLVDADVSTLRRYFFGKLVHRSSGGGMMAPSAHDVVLGGYDQADATSLIYLLVATARGLEVGPVGGFRYSTHDIGLFTVHIYTCYTSIQTSNSVAETPLSFSPQLNQEKLGDRHHGKLPNETVEDVRTELLNAITTIGHRSLDRHIKEHPGLEFLRNVPLWFYPSVEDLAIARQLGLTAIVRPPGPSVGLVR